MTARRLSRRQRGTIALAVGGCPVCTSTAQGLFPGHNTVIYRRSNRSITMRCDTCGLQWTMTLAKINQAMKRRVELAGDPKDDGGMMAAALYGELAAMTEFAVANERRGRRRA